MSARSKARKRALDVLFAAEAREIDPLEVLAERLADPDAAVGDYAERLVRGVVTHRERIDDLLTQYAQEWSLDRMPAVDRAILRIGVFELIGVPEVPAPVVIDEAVEAAKTLSTDNSPRFVNGVLGQIVAVADHLQV